MGGCGFYTGYENRNQVAVDKLDKGDRLDKVGCGKLRSETNRTKVSPKIVLMKSSENNFRFLFVFYLIKWVMK